MKCPERGGLIPHFRGKFLLRRIFRGTLERMLQDAHEVFVNLRKCPLVAKSATKFLALISRGEFIFSAKVYVFMSISQCFLCNILYN